MKHLLACLLLLLTACSGIAHDKRMHAGVSFGLASSATILTHATGDEVPFWQRGCLSVGSTLAVGAAKELSDNHFDWYDMEADAIGAVSGWLISEGVVWVWRMVNK